MISRQHLGTSTLDNLALACNLCNLHKGPNVAGIDAATGQLVPLFNPRRDVWNEHFIRQGPEIVGRSAVGQVTVQVLNMNDAAAVEVRRMAIAAALLDD